MIKNFLAIFGFLGAPGSDPSKLSLKFSLLDSIPTGKTEKKTTSSYLKSKNIGSSQLELSENIKTFRIAISATGEFTSFWGDDDDSNGTNSEDAFAAVASTINRVNEVFENDLGIHLELVSDSSLLYDNPETDPYTDDLNEEVQKLDLIANTIFIEKFKKKQEHL